MPVAAAAPGAFLGEEAVTEFLRTFNAKVDQARQMLESAKQAHRSIDDDMGRSIDKVMTLI